MSVRVRIAASVVALAFVAAGCGGDAATTAGAGTTSRAPDPSGGPSAAPASDRPVGIPEVLEFEAPLLDGGTLRGVDYAGKDVAFWFWAPW
jgi:hypothetical protein